MPIDAGIYSQIKPIELPNQLAQMANVMQLQHAMSQNELSKYQLSSAQRTDEQKTQLTNYLKTADPNNPNLHAELMRFGDPGIAVSKSIQDQQLHGVSMNEKQVKIAAEKKAMNDSALRDLSVNPSDAQITAHLEDRIASPLFSPVEKARTKAIADQLLALPYEKRAAMISGMGASAKDTLELTSSKPVEKTDGQRTWMEESNPRLPNFGKPITAPIQQKASPNTVYSQGQENYRANLGKFVPELGGTVTPSGKLAPVAGAAAAASNISAAKETGTVTAKNTIAAQQALPQIIDSVQKTSDVINQMIGDATVKDGKIVIPKGGKSPHPGFSVAVGASAQPGFQYIPGTDKANFYALKDQVTGDAFLQAYKDSLKGGGSITEIEGEKGTQALLRARTAQSEPEFIKAMREFQDANQKMLKRAQGAASGGSGVITHPSFPGFSIPKG